MKNLTILFCSGIFILTSCGYENTSYKDSRNLNQKLDVAGVYVRETSNEVKNANKEDKRMHN